MRHRLPAAARRIQLLEVALERFAASGYHGTSMDEIAEAAGVTKPVLYQHFSSKRKLYQELLDTVGQQMLESVAAQAGAASQPYQRVLAGFRANFTFVSQHADAFQLVFGTGARRTDEFAETVRRLEDDMAAVIGGYIDADIDDEHRDLLGYAIVGLGEVAARRWVSLHEGAPPLDPAETEALAVRLADLVFAGLRSLPGSETQARRQATS
jgi:AcrR family transcriptional regulator